MRIAVRVGIAAAVVQVIGLLRWPILVPGYAADGNADAFRTASDILGTAIGETLGYPLTAAWTALVVVALGRASPAAGSPCSAARPRRSSLVGVLSPLDLPVVDEANFIGYVLWSVWLIAFGVVLLRARRRARWRWRREPPLARARRAVHEPARDRRRQHDRQRRAADAGARSRRRT